MIFNTLLSVFGSRNSLEKKSDGMVSRHKYIIDKYHERSITSRYFK